MRHVLAFLIVSLAACGGDDDSATCDAPGTASVDGMVGAVELDDVRTVLSGPVTEFGDYLTFVIIAEGDGTCTGTPTDGDKLILYFCAPPTAGSYDVVAIENFPELACPGDRVASALVERGASDEASAAGGSVTIQEVGDCLTGSFSIDLVGEEAVAGQLAGSFSALVCPELGI